MHTKETLSGGRHHKLAAIPGTVHTGFFDNSLTPALTIDSGDTVSVEIMMLADGRVRPGISIEEIARLRVEYRAKGRSNHSLTGPIYINGAEPGDVLEVSILRLAPYSYGVHYIVPGAMGAGTLPEEFPEGLARTFEWNQDGGEVLFQPGVRLPLRPFLGVMAVAPATPGEVSSVPPGSHGGNMDLKELTEGATIYLPVFVHGALFSVGDVHALQGDGEVSGTTLETAAKEARLRFVVRKDLRMERPMAETSTHWITMGFHPDLDEAAKIALRDAIQWLVLNKGLSRLDAYSLCCMAVDFRVTQLVDRNKGIHAMIPKGIFKD